MNNEALCDARVVDEETVAAVREAQLDHGVIDRLADMFGMLSSPTRLRLLEALSERELCVCDLAAVAGVSESAVSHHLRLLRQLRIVRFRKEGRMAFYRLDDEHVAEIVSSGLEHAAEEMRSRE